MIMMRGGLICDTTEQDVKDVGSSQAWGAHFKFFQYSQVQKYPKLPHNEPRANS